MKKKILIVNWGTQDKEYVFSAAKEKNIDIFLATSSQYPHWLSKFVNKKNIIITNTYDSECLIIDVVSYLHERHIKLDGITTFFEMNIIQTADLAYALNLPFLNPAAAHRSSNNKLLMRHWCNTHNISSPKFATFTDIKTGLEQLKKFTGPVIIKPIKSGHSYGVIKIEGIAAIDRANDFVNKYPKARNQMDGNYDEWMQKWPYKNYFLIEEFLEGKVISIDGLIQLGKYIFIGSAEFELSEPPLMLEQITYIPARISSQNLKKCINMTKKIINALGFDNCGFHCEMKLTPKGPVLLEIAARLPGGQMTKGYKQAYGIDLTQLYLNICCQIQMETLLPQIRFHVIQESIPLPTLTATVTKIDGLEELYQSQHLQIYSHCNIGDSTLLDDSIPRPACYYQGFAQNMHQLNKLRQYVYHTLHIATTKKTNMRHLDFLKNSIKLLLKFFDKTDPVVMDRD